MTGKDHHQVQLLRQNHQKSHSKSQEKDKHFLTN